MFTGMTTDTRRRGQGVKSAVVEPQPNDEWPNPTSGTESQLSAAGGCLGVEVYIGGVSGSGRSQKVHHP